MTEEKKQKYTLPRYAWIALVIVAVIGLGTGGYFYMQYQKSQQLLQNPTLAAKLQTTDLLMKVGKLIDLPQSEQPTIATVSDVTKLKGQPFFVNAKNGDKVLIYAKARKAILYDPVADKIIDVTELNIQNPTPTPTITPVKKTTK